MPVDMPNRQLFRPYYPKSKDNHVLFGHKYHKIHQFRDERWLPTAPISQYKYMVNVLSKNLKFRKLEKNVHNIVDKRNLISLRNQCHDGRLLLRSAKQGNLTRISNILLQHRELRRMYQGLPSHLIVDKINQRTFLKRKENDRLKFKLKVLMETYHDKLNEEARLVDRVKYENEFILADDIKAKHFRTELANSVTRIKSFKLINGAYENILETLKKDDIYLESILNSLEDDILEQSNFIQQVVLLGIPAMQKFQKLAADYKQSENHYRQEIRDTVLYITQYKRKVKDEEDQTKDIIRKNCDSIGQKGIYHRETLSMITLRTNIEETNKIVQELKNATYSPGETAVLPIMEKTVMQNKKMETDLVKEDQYRLRLEEIEMRCEAMRSSLINNVTESDIERMRQIKSLEDAIKYEKASQRVAKKQILKNGKIFDSLRMSLNNIKDILRHVGTPLPPSKQQYPNEELKLPLLNFTHENRNINPPPILRAYELERLMDMARERITILVSEYNKYGGRTRDNFNKLYTKAYLESIKPSESIFTDTRKTGSLEFLIEKADVSCPSRIQIKSRSSKIVGEHKMKQELGDI